MLQATRGLVVLDGARIRDLADLVGWSLNRNGRTEHVDGPLVRAMRDGLAMYVKRLEALPAPCEELIVRAAQGGALLVTHSGERVWPRAGFCLLVQAPADALPAVLPTSGILPGDRVADATANP